MKQYYNHDRGPAIVRRKASGMAGSQAVGLPPLLRACRIIGTTPVLSDKSLTLAGTTIQFAWFNTPSDRATSESPIIGAELRIESCEKYRIPALLRSLKPAASAGGQPNRTLEDRAQRFECKGVLIEDVSPDSLYGRWVRLQGCTDAAKLDATMKDGKISTRFEFHLLVGQPSGREAAALKLAYALDAVQGQTQIICPELRGDVDRYSDMQIDRFFEVYRLLSMVTRLGLYPPTGARVQREAALAAVEEQELALLPELTTTYERLFSLRREYDKLCAANAEEEARLRALVTVREGLTLEQAEENLRAKREELGLDAAKLEKSNRDEELKRLKRQIKNQQDARLVAARRAAKDAETRRIGIERALRPFEEKVRAARKVDRGPQERLDAFLRSRKQKEEAAGQAFNGFCTSSRALWKRADDAFFRRQELICLLGQA